MPYLSTDSRAFVCALCVAEGRINMNEPLDDVETTDFLIALLMLGGDPIEHACADIFNCQCTCNAGAKTAASQVRK